MIRTLTLCALALSTAAFSIACTDDKAATETAPAAAKAKVELPEMSVTEVAALIAKPGAKVAVLDANGDETRSSKGVIPGATLLSSYREYDLKELPAEKDTKLVFYCGSTTCHASDAAAIRAKENGYEDVCVLRAGIKGWAESGQKTVAYKGDAKEEAVEKKEDGKEAAK